MSPFDNSNTKKEGVSRTYKGCDGYAPIFAYLGQEGYGIHVQLCEGKTHCQFKGDEFLAQSIRYARRKTTQDLLVRMDAGNDSTDNIRVCFQPETHADFIIKRNPRKETAESWLAIAQQKGECESPREQFHSELKTDLDLERLPAGKFATNELILHLGVLTYNLIRIIGQESLKTSDAPLKKKYSAAG